MTPKKNIEDTWFVSPNHWIEDICRATGQNVVRVLLESARADEKVRIVTKSLNADFYDDLVSHFEAVNGQIEIIVKEFDTSLLETGMGKFASKHAKLWSVSTEAQKKMRMRRFLLVGDRAFRLNVRTDPFKATSFLNNTMVGTFLVKQFEDAKKVATPISSPEEIDAHSHSDLSYEVV